MNTIELAFDYIRGHISEESLLSILGDEALVANVISIAHGLSDRDMETLKKLKRD